MLCQTVRFILLFLLSLRISAAPNRNLTDEWPGTTDFLVFLWQPDVADSYKFFEIRDQAEIKAHSLEITRGALLAHEKTNEFLLRHLKPANELTLECVIKTSSLEQTGPARILSFSNDSQNRNFTLGQEGGNLIFRLRTPQTGNNGNAPESVIGALRENRAVHVVVTYQNGNLRAYLDGEEVFNSQKVQGDFSNWEPARFILGDEWKDARHWQGNLSYIALYNLAVTGEEASARYRLWQKRN